MPILFIETRYILRDEKGEMFNEETVVTELPVKIPESVDSIIDIHTQKLGNRERVIRIQARDLIK